jgi:hypothetical protein
MPSIYQMKNQSWHKFAESIGFNMDEGKFMIKKFKKHLFSFKIYYFILLIIFYSNFSK